MLVGYNFNQPVSSVTRFSRGSVIDKVSLPGLIAFRPPVASYFPSHPFPDPAVVPTVKGCCLTLPDL